eukprot:s2938_g15.t1
MVSARLLLGALLALGLSTSAEDPGLLAEVARLKAEVERLKAWLPAVYAGLGNRALPLAFSQAIAHPALTQ